MAIKTTIIEVSIHEESENAVYGEGVIKMRLEDEAAGGFFSLRQDRDDLKQKVEMTIEEIRVVHLNASDMLEAYNQNEKVG